MQSLLVAAIIMVPLLILGIFGNLHLIYATAKSKQLQHRNGILVGIIAFLNFVNEMFEAKNVIEIFMGRSKMKRATCYYTTFLYEYSFDMSAIAILFLAIDRFIAVWLPVKYRQLRSTNFIVIALATGFVYATPFVVIDFFVVDDALVEPCYPPKAIMPGLMLVWTYGYVSIGVIVILLNIGNYFRLLRSGKKRKMSPDNDIVSYQQQAQITNSLLVMMAAYCLTTFLASAILFTHNLLRVDEDITVSELQKQLYPLTVLIQIIRLVFQVQRVRRLAAHCPSDEDYIMSFLCLLMLMHYGNNYYILFWRNRVYRTVFLGHLHFKSKGVIIVAQVAEMHEKIGKNDAKDKSVAKRKQTRNHLRRVWPIRQNFSN